MKRIILKLTFVLSLLFLPYAFSVDNKMTLPQIITQSVNPSGVDYSEIGKIEQAVHKAIKKGFEKLEKPIEVAIKNGADVNVRSESGFTALALVAFTNNKASAQAAAKIAQILIKNGADLNEKDEAGNTALHWAAGKGNLEIIKLLIEKGADVNVKNAQDISPIHMAAYSRNVNVMDFLIKNGADVNEKGMKGTTALHELARNTVADNRWDSLKKEDPSSPLAQATALKRSVYGSGYTGTSLEMARFLTKNGADVNVKDDEGKTPLHIFASAGQMDVIKFLIKNGADTKLKDKDGLTHKDILKEKHPEKFEQHYKN